MFWKRLVEPEIPYGTLRICPSPDGMYHIDRMENFWAHFGPLPCWKGIAWGFKTSHDAMERVNFLSQKEIVITRSNDEKTHGD